MGYRMNWASAAAAVALTLGTLAPVASADAAPGSPAHARPVAASQSGLPPLREQARTGGKVVYLTFDDGPSGYTPQILSILAAHNAKATFFMVGYQAAGNQSLVRRVLREGHAVGNHTWSHANLTRLSSAGVASQLQRDKAVLTSGMGRCFRPPYGATNSRVRKVAASKGYRQILWSVDPKDWTRPGSNVIFNRVVSRVRNGAIVLLHDGGGPRSSTVAATRRIVAWLDSHGYQMITLPACR